jgi:hypothetical protein
LAIFKPKKLRLSFQELFLSWDDSPSPNRHLESLVVEGIKAVTHFAYLQDIAPGNLLSFQDLSRADWPLAVPGLLQDKLGKG